MRGWGGIKGLNLPSILVMYASGCIPLPGGVTVQTYSGWAMGSVSKLEVSSQALIPGLIVRCLCSASVKDCWPNSFFGRSLQLYPAVGWVYRIVHTQMESLARILAWTRSQSMFSDQSCLYAGFRYWVGLQAGMGLGRATGWTSGFPMMIVQSHWLCAARVVQQLSRSTGQASCLGEFIGDSQSCLSSLDWLPECVGVKALLSSLTRLKICLPVQAEQQNGLQPEWSIDGEPE